MPNKRKLKEIDFNKTYSNASEQAFAVEARKNGWAVTKQGYPDFICYKGDDIMLVEVKNGNHRLKTSQYKFMNKVSSKGIRCYKWTKEKNFFA